MRIVGRFLGILLLIAILAGFFVEVVAPRMNWSAAAEPGPAEEWLADRVIGGWITRNASTEKNPVAESAQNLKAGQADYKEHCAGCHGLDGGGRNRLGADFYPSIPKLTEDAQQMTDGEIYFIIAKGIRYSAMPAFEVHHKPDEIWRMVLWVRHLGHLSPEEKTAIQAEMRAREERHKAAAGEH